MTRDIAGENLLLLYDKIFTINKWYNKINCCYRYHTNKFTYLCDAGKVSNKISRFSTRIEFPNWQPFHKCSCCRFVLFSVLFCFNKNCSEATLIVDDYFRHFDGFLSWILSRALMYVFCVIFLKHNQDHRGFWLALLFWLTVSAENWMKWK